MKKNVLRYTTIAMLALAGNLFAVDADIDGATPGKWTMDLEAAKKAAAEKQLPILLDFSGSDWCGWCKLMEENVFTQPEWTAWATNNIMMVLLDFPQDKSLVPEKYVERNDALNEQYDITGFPTFIILDNDGKTELGRLGAGREKTPESFIAEIKQLLKNSPAEMAAFEASLSPEKKAAYEELANQLEQTKQALDEQVEVVEAANQKAAELQESIVKLEADLQMFRMEESLSEEELAAYKDLQEKYDAATQKLEDWIATGPERTDENIKLFEDMRDEITQLEAALSKY